MSNPLDNKFTIDPREERVSAAASAYALQQVKVARAHRALANEQNQLAQMKMRLREAQKALGCEVEE